MFGFLSEESGKCTRRSKHTKQLSSRHEREQPCASRQPPMRRETAVRLTRQPGATVAEARGNRVVRRWTTHLGPLLVRCPTESCIVSLDALPLPPPAVPGPEPEASPAPPPPGPRPSAATPGPAHPRCPPPGARFIPLCSRRSHSAASWCSGQAAVTAAPATCARCSSLSAVATHRRKGSSCLPASQAALLHSAGCIAGLLNAQVVQEVSAGSTGTVTLLLWG